MHIGLELGRHVIYSTTILYQRVPSNCRLCKLIQIYSQTFGMWEGG